MTPDLAPLQSAIARCLPGRLAGLVKLEEPEGLIQLPDFVQAKERHLEIGPAKLAINLCVSSGVSEVKPGEQFASMPNEGLWINHMDKDIPELGKHVPKGYQLRLYGAWGKVDDQLMGKYAA